MAWSLPLVSSIQLAFLLLLLFPQHAVAGGDAEWNRYVYEYDLIEMLILMVLVVFAILFESVVHHVWHLSEHAYHYGMIHDAANGDDEHGLKKDHHGNLHHPRLLKALINRMSGEFMTLGFLALMIFSLNQAEFFDWLAEIFQTCEARRLTTAAAKIRRDCWHVPGSGYDWLHMCEIAHVKLFFGMILYFIIMFRTVRRSESFIKKLEHLRLRRLMAKETTGFNLKLDQSLKHYQDMRTYLILNVLLWHKTRRSLFKKIVKSVSFQKEWKGLPKAEKMTRIRDRIDERLSMSAYLAYNVENGVVDSIQVHETTWGFIFFMFAVFALCNRFAHIELAHMLPFFVAIGILFDIVMLCISRDQRRKIRGFAESDLCQTRLDDEVDKIDFGNENSEASGASHTQVSPGVAAVVVGAVGAVIDGAIDGAARISEKTSKTFQIADSKPTNTGADGMKSTISHATTVGFDDDTRTWYEKHLHEKHMMRGLQVVMFMLSFGLADSLADKHKWKEYTLQTLILSMAYIIIFIVMTFVIPDQIPVFLQLTALPPYVDQDNLESFMHVLLDDHAIISDNLRKSDSANSVGSRRDMMASGSYLSAAESMDQLLIFADVIGECRDFKSLAKIKEQLLQRLAAKEQDLESV
jgi:hypothetical protein